MIGGGAAGLICAATLSKTTTTEYNVVVYEKSPCIGGVWRYLKRDEMNRPRPMYSSLRCNLPKEIMELDADHRFDPSLPSYVTHADVQAYLEAYVAEEDLLPLIRFNTAVESVTKEGGGWRVRCGPAGPAETVGTAGTGSSELYDAVIVCNGHYNVPVVPGVEGLAGYRGEQLHSIEYDNPSLSRYAGKNVVVVGSRSSGTDMAREISSVAAAVYVADRGLAAVDAAVHGLIYHKPAITRFQGDRTVVFADGAEVEADVVLWCTGFAYDYHPFLKDKAAGGCVEVCRGRKVNNLYHHLFAIDDPSICFVGLPWAVVPFPLFRLQAQWIDAVFSGRAQLPPADEQRAWLVADEAACADRFAHESDPATAAVERYHYMGGALQWTYYRFLARAAGLATDRQMRYALPRLGPPWPALARLAPTCPAWIMRIVNIQCAHILPPLHPAHLQVH